MTAECYRGATVVKPVGFATGNGEGSRRSLAAAHKRGVAIGRPRALTPEQILMAEAMTADPAISTRQVAEQFGIHRSTLYRHLNARQKRSA